MTRNFATPWLYRRTRGSSRWCTWAKRRRCRRRSRGRRRRRRRPGSPELTHETKGTAMIRIPGWILGAVLTLAVAACGAGEKADDSPATTATQPPSQPATQPATQPPARPEPEPEPQPVRPAVPEGRLYTVQVASFITQD